MLSQLSHTGLGGRSGGGLFLYDASDAAWGAHGGKHAPPADTMVDLPSWLKGKGPSPSGHPQPRSDLGTTTDSEAWRINSGLQRGLRVLQPKGVADAKKHRDAGRGRGAGEGGEGPPPCPVQSQCHWLSWAT